MIFLTFVGENTEQMKKRILYLAIGGVFLVLGSFYHSQWGETFLPERVIKVIGIALGIYFMIHGLRKKNYKSINNNHNEKI